MPNFRPMFIFKDGERAGNAQVFATYKEANDSAAARFMDWIQPEKFDVDETEDPVNYVRLSKRGDVSLRALERERVKDAENLTRMESGGEDWIYPY